MVKKEDWQTYRKLRRKYQAHSTTHEFFSLSVNCDLAAKGRLEKMTLSKNDAIRVIESIDNYYTDLMNNWREVVEMAYAEKGGE